MLITQKITLDLMRSGVPPVVNVMQADINTRAVEASLYAGGVPFSEDGDVTISVAYKKPDGTGGWYDVLPDGSTAATITGNVVTAKLAPQVLSVPGTVDATLRIESVGETHRVSTFPFVIQVEADPGSNATVSENYYTVQNWDDVNRNIDELWAAVNSGAGGGEAVPGGYYLPSVTQPNASQMKVSYAASQPGMPSVSPVSVNLPVGPKGDPGLTPHIGANGNWWIGTTDTGISAGGGSGGGTVSNAVLYTAQTLTDDQKKQARKNIGAIGNGEHINMNGKSISGAYQVSFIQNADDAKPVRMSKGIRSDEAYLYLLDVNKSAPVILGGIRSGEQDTDAVNVAQLNDAIASVGGGSGGVSTMIVRMQNDDYADETAEVINQHISRGGLAYFFDGDYYYPLAADVAHCASIGLIQTYNGKFLYVEIDQDGTVTYNESDYSDLADNLSGVAKDVQNLMQQMDDIETALDRIIDIQNELIGGGA